MSPISPFGAPFDPPPLAAWRTRVEEGLRGADFGRRLVTRTPEGLALQPLYTEADAPAGGWPGPQAWAGARAGGWRIVQPAATDGSAEALAAARAELEGGADGLLLDLGGEGGAARAAALVGALALEGRTLALEGSLDGGALDLPEGVALHLGVDPLGLLLHRGRLPGGASALAEAGRLGARCATRRPATRALAVDLRPLHLRGGHAVDLLGMGLATGVAYLRALDAAGLGGRAAFDQLVFRLPLGTELLQAIALQRALRRLWARVAEASGAPGAPALVHAFPALRGWTRRDPAVNLLRATAMVFSAACGGADLVTTIAPDGVDRRPGALGRRQARNVQLVLREESALGRVIDPAGGAHFFEAWTEALAQAGWARFQAIEAQGGALACLVSGDLRPSLVASQAELRAAVATRRRPLTGLSEFALLAEAPPPPRLPAPPHPGPGPDDLVLEVPPPLWLAAPFEALRDRGDSALLTRGRRPAVFLAPLGPPAEHGARVTFTRNLLAAGGLDALEGPDPAAFAASGCAVAVVCGADAAYVAEAPALVAALRGAGARQVWLAGRPGALAPALASAGLTDALFLGCDAVAALERMWTDVEVSP